MVTLDLSIDPGIEMGWAIWDGSVSAETQPTPQPPLDTGIISPRKDAPWISRSNLIMWAFDNLVKQTGDAYEGRVENVYCEWPGYFDDAAGQLTASSGALVKLTIAVGRVMQYCQDHRLKFFPIQVGDWKGQVSKEVVERRIRRRLGDAVCSGFRKHVWDAVGVGLYVKGWFNAGVSSQA